MKELLQDAMERPEAERDVYLEDACKGDAELLIELRTFLSVDELSAGKLIKERYRVERKLGQGGIATTFLARDIVLSDRRVVIKVLSDENTDPYVQNKFVEEVHALAILEHPHIVAPLDHGTLNDGRPFLITQFAEGRTLRELMQSGPLALDRAADILQQIGGALAFIHRNGVVHRDLKPENVIVQTIPGGSDHVCLIDFGIATVQHNRPEAITRVIGSIAYMAPEQLGGHVSALSDIYAFGVLAYELLTGHIPFQSDNPLEHMQMQRRENAEPPTELRAGLPARSNDLVLRALRFEPERRPQDAAALGEMLQDALRTTPSIRKRNYFQSPAAAISASILALAAFTWWGVDHHAALSHPNGMMLKPAPDRALLDAAKFSVALFGRDGQMLSHGTAKAVLTEGGDFRIRVNTSVSTHLYIFTESDGDDLLRVLFPSPTSNGGNSQIAPGDDLSIPEKSWFHVSPGSSQESLYFVLSHAENPELEESRKWANSRDRGKIADPTGQAKIRNILRGQYKIMMWQDGRAEVSYKDALAVARLDLSHQ